MTAKTKKTKAKLNLVEMIAKGLIKPGERLQAHYAGKSYTATVLKDGQIKMLGRTYTSISHAGRTIVRTRVKDGQCNGYEFFGIVRDGKVVSVESLRKG